MPQKEIHYTSAPLPNATTPWDKSLLPTFINFSYYISFSPYKLQTLSDGSVKLKGSYFRKVFCIIIVICSNLLRFAEVRNSTPKSNELWNALYYFVFLSGFINIIYNGTVVVSIFWNAEGIAKIASFLNQSHTLPCSHLTQLVKSAVRLVCVLEVLLAIVIATGDVKLMTSFHNDLSWDRWVFCMKEEAKFILFLGDISECRNPINLNGTFHNFGEEQTLICTVSNYIIAIGICSIILLRHLYGYFGELILVTGIIEFWLPAHAFNKIAKNDFSIEESESDIIPFVTKFEILHGQYTTIKRFSKLVNDVFGRMLFWFILASIFFYSCNLDELVITKDPFLRIRVLSFYVSAISIYLFAADINYKIKGFGEWISEQPAKETSLIPQSTLTIILHEMESNRIGIRGNNIFTVTYAFIANMTGVLITYFIVCVQARTPWVYSGGSDAISITSG